MGKTISVIQEDINSLSFCHFQKDVLLEQHKKQQKYTNLQRNVGNQQSSKSLQYN